ncbi:hypothetical protein U1Q18_009290 [Sarracenia purpurea var. burkii]
MMGSNTFGASQRLTDLAQQLRLFKPLCPPAAADNHRTEDPTAQAIAGKLVRRQDPAAMNAGSATNPIAKLPDQRTRSAAKRAAVLICLFEDEKGDLRVILTKRSSTLSTHSGDVSLPGGKTEEGDADDVETALREAKEEIGLDPSLVNVVAVLEPFFTKVFFLLIRWGFKLQY